MALNRRLNDFDNFISLGPQPMISPRQQPLNPINNYTSNASPYRPHTDPHRHTSPNKINMTRKPMISPSRSPRQQPVMKTRGRVEQVPIRSQQSNWQSVQDRVCSNQNHPHKKAEFFIIIENEEMYYCEKCATQAASQGFKVSRIISNKMSKKSNKVNRTLPNIPHYSNNIRYKQIMEFLKKIIIVQDQCSAIDPEQVNRHYQEQEALLNNFYGQISTIVDKMREDHLADLREEHKKSCQEAALKQEDLKNNLEEVEETWDDICQNIDAIVEQIDQANYMGCMNQYQNSIQMFSHQLEQYAELTQNFTSYHPNSLNAKVEAFERKLGDLFEEDEHQVSNRAPVRHQQYQQHQQHQQHQQYQQHQQQAAMIPFSDRNKTIKNVHENLPRNPQQNGQNQGAFRNLFPDDEGQERLPEASPQFKAF